MGVIRERGTEGAVGRWCLPWDPLPSPSLPPPPPFLLFLPLLHICGCALQTVLSPWGVGCVPRIRLDAFRSRRLAPAPLWSWPPSPQAPSPRVRLVSAGPLAAGTGIDNSTAALVSALRGLLSPQTLLVGPLAAAGQPRAGLWTVSPP